MNDITPSFLAAGRSKLRPIYRLRGQWLPCVTRAARVADIACSSTAAGIALRHGHHWLVWVLDGYASRTQVGRTLREFESHNPTYFSYAGAEPVRLEHWRQALALDASVAMTVARLDVAGCPAGVFFVCGDWNFGASFVHKQVVGALGQLVSEALTRELQMHDEAAARPRLAAG